MGVRVIQSLRKNVDTMFGAISAYTNMCILAGPDPNPYPEHRDKEEVTLDKETKLLTGNELEHKPRT